MNGLTLHKISKYYDAAFALSEISFNVQRSEVVAVLGPSGGGKSTLLSIIAGLIKPDQGDVLWDGVSMQHTAPHLRAFGLMFQDLALFPHRNVFDNIAFGLQMAHLPAGQIRQRVAEVLQLVNLPGFGARDVNTLSGGEQQRVALARSLAPRPRLLMLDEPLGALDRVLREQLVVELGQVLHTSQQTTLYVTHDQEEAFTLADRVVVMSPGHVEQIGTPQQIYRQPATEFVARFLGLTNLIPGTLEVHGATRIVQTALGTFPVSSGDAGAVTMLLRPDSVRLDPPGDGELHGQVLDVNFRGQNCRAMIGVNGFKLNFNFSSNIELPGVGQSIRLYFNANDAIQIIGGNKD